MMLSPLAGRARRAACLLFVSLIACSPEEPPATALADDDGAFALPVTARPVVLQNRYEVTEAYAGRVVSHRQSALGFERGGRLVEVRVDQGDRVEAGQVLAVLDRDALLAREQEWLAQVAQSEARLGLARLTSGRTRNLAASDSASRQQLDQATYEERALAAQLAGAQASLAAVRVDLADSELVAPFAGVITARLADEGTVVAAGQPLLELIEDRELEVEIGLPVERAVGLTPGSRHPLEIDGRTVEAELQVVVSQVRPGTRTQVAVFRLIDPPPMIRSGSMARLALTRTIPGDGFWVPIGALAESRRGLWSVYALREADGHAERFRLDRRQVEVIHTEADRAFVRGTVQDGESLMATGLHRVVPGQLVRVVATRSEIADRELRPTAIQ